MNDDIERECILSPLKCCSREEREKEHTKNDDENNFYLLLNKNTQWMLLISDNVITH